MSLNDLETRDEKEIINHARELAKLIIEAQQQEDKKRRSGREKEDKKGDQDEEKEDEKGDQDEEKKEKYRTFLRNLLNIATSVENSDLICLYFAYYFVRNKREDLGRKVLEIIKGWEPQKVAKLIQYWIYACYEYELRNT